MNAKRIFSRSILAAGMLALCGNFAACSDDDVVASAVDTKTLPVSDWKDTSYAAGDNFFMYCNGKYWNEHELSNNYEDGFYDDETSADVANYVAQAEHQPRAEWLAFRRTVYNSTYVEADHEPYAKAVLSGYLSSIMSAESKAELAQVLAQIIEDGGSTLYTISLYLAPDAENRLKYVPCWALDINENALVKFTAGDLASVFQMLGVGEEEAEELSGLAAGLTNDYLSDDEAAENAPRRAHAAETLVSEAEDEGEGALHRRRHHALLPDLSEVAPRENASAAPADRFDQLIAAALGDMEHLMPESILSEEFIATLDFFDEQPLEVLKAACAAFIAVDYLAVSPTACAAFIPSRKSGAVQYEYLNVANVYSKLNYSQGYYLAKTMVSEEKKAAYKEICEELRSALSARIETRDWMSATTKAKAQEKLAALKFHIGGPDEWITDAVVNLDGSLYSNIQQIRQKDFLLARTAASGDRGAAEIHYTFAKGSVNSTSLNGYYSPNFNILCVLSPFLTERCFSSTVSDAYNYGVIGAIVGHEIVHGFDSTGAKYDKEGVRSDWWTLDDGMEFQERCALLTECYNQLQLYPEENPDLYCDGANTLNENIADLGGVLIGLDAYKARLAREGYYGEELTKQIKKYFEAYVETERHKYTINYVNYYKTDEHAFHRERVNGVMMNIDEWYDAYGVQPGHKLYLSPARRAYIW